MTKAKNDRASTKNTSRMQLEVKNFGPIAKGHVEFRPLTVFAGPSNTGKSWLATLIYVMARHAEGVNAPSMTFEKSRGISRFPKNPERWIKSLESTGKVKLTASEIEAVCEFLKSLEGNLEEEFRRCYGIGQSSDLIRHGSHRQAQLSAHLGQVSHHLNLTRRAREMFSLNVDIPKEVVLGINKKEPQYLDVLTTYLHRINMSRGPKNSHGATSPDTYNVIEAVTEGLLSSQAGGKVHYLPAGRTGVMRNRSVMIGALIRNASRTSLRPASTQPLLPGVLGDFLEQIHIIVEYAAQQKIRERSRHDLGISLEDEILQGAIEVVPGEAGVPQIFYRPKGWKGSLPLTNVSSMVSELAPLVLYLRYSVSPGDLLIIEEPEAHLHPTTQRELTHQIALLVRAGIRVLITTDSEWILEELANTVARGEMKKNNRSDVAGLMKEDVGVWLFEPANKNRPTAGSKIKEASWKPDEGGYVADFDKVAIELHNEWVDAMNQTL